MIEREDRDPSDPTNRLITIPSEFLGVSIGRTEGDNQLAFVVTFKVEPKNMTANLLLNCFDAVELHKALTMAITDAKLKGID